MAEFVFKDASIVINAVDLSDHCRSVTLNYEAEMVDSTAHGDDDREFLAGLRNWSLDCEFEQDHAAGSVDATLFSLVGAAGVTVTLKPTSAAVGATNPSFSGTALVSSYNPMGGGVGDHATTSVNLQGSGALTRAVA